MSFVVGGRWQRLLQLEQEQRLLGTCMLRTASEDLSEVNLRPLDLAAVRAEGVEGGDDPLRMFPARTDDVVDLAASTRVVHR